MTQPPDHLPSRIVWWAALALTLAVLGSMVLGCRAIIVRTNGDVNLNTTETETRTQTAGTNGRNRNLEIELDGR